MPSLVWDEDFEVDRTVRPLDSAGLTSVSASASAAVRGLLVRLPPRRKTPLASPVPAIVVRNTARASPCGRRVVVWCHSAAETLEACYPAIRRAAARRMAG